MGGEAFFQDLAGSHTGHHDHEPQSDILEDDRQPLVLTTSRHHLSLGVEVAKAIVWRYRLEAIPSQVNPLRNRMSAGYMAFTHRTAGV